MVVLDAIVAQSPNHFLASPNFPRITKSFQIFTSSSSALSRPLHKVSAHLRCNHFAAEIYVLSHMVEPYRTEVSRESYFDAPDWQI